MCCHIYCSLHGGELFDYVIEKDYLDEAEAVYYMTQILEGLDYMHKKNIVHLDLKVGVHGGALAAAMMSNYYQLLTRFTSGGYYSILS